MVVLIIILAFERLRQEDYKFEGSLAILVRAYLNKCSSLEYMGRTERKMAVSRASHYPCHHRGERYITLVSRRGECRVCFVQQWWLQNHCGNQ